MLTFQQFCKLTEEQVQELKTRFFPSTGKTFLWKAEQRRKARRLAKKEIEERMPKPVTKGPENQFLKNMKLKNTQVAEDSKEE